MAGLWVPGLVLFLCFSGLGMSSGMSFQRNGWWRRLCCDKGVVRYVTRPAFFGAGRLFARVGGEASVAVVLDRYGVLVHGRLAFQGYTAVRVRTHFDVKSYGLICLSPWGDDGLELEGLFGCACRKSHALGDLVVGRQ